MVLAVHGIIDVIVMLFRIYTYLELNKNLYWL